MYAQQPYAQQPYPLHDQKQVAPDRLPLYTRRGFATFVHTLLILQNIFVIVTSIRMLISPLTMFKASQIEKFPTVKRFILLPPVFFVVLGIEHLVAGVTSILAIATPKFLHRKQSTVFLSLFPAIIARVLDVGLWCYCFGFSFLWGLLGHALMFFGMLQGSKENVPATTFIPFRKQ